MLIKNWREFSTALIVEQELDPLYDFAVTAIRHKGRDWGYRYVMHLLTFYDVGGAVQAADLTTEESFWDYVIANYDSFPRGTNRRHSRGDIGKRYVLNMEKLGTPKVLLKKMWAPHYDALATKMRDFMPYCGFGDYFIWKVMDYQDRVLDRPVLLLLHEAVKYMPDEAKKGAKLLWPTIPLHEVLITIVRHIRAHKAPGLSDRDCNFAEAETILCALRGWHQGVYQIGDDIRERHKQLKKFPQYLEFLPPVPPTDKYERPNTMDTQALSAGIP